MIGTDLEYGDKVRIASGVDEGKRGMIIGIALNRIPTLATIICENVEDRDRFESGLKITILNDKVKRIKS